MGRGLSSVSLSCSVRMGAYTGGGLTTVRAPGAGFPLLLGAGLRVPGRDWATALARVAASSNTINKICFFIF